MGRMITKKRAGIIIYRRTRLRARATGIRRDTSSMLRKVRIKSSTARGSTLLVSRWLHTARTRAMMSRETSSANTNAPEKQKLKVAAGEAVPLRVVRVGAEVVDNLPAKGRHPNREQRRR